MSAFAARYARAFADVVADAHLDPAEVEQQLGDFRCRLAGERRTARGFPESFVSHGAEGVRFSTS